MVNYWFCVTNEENWKVVKTRKVWGVSDRNRRRMEEVKLGDVLIFYVKPQMLAGVFKIISEPFESHEKIFSTSGFAVKEEFPHRVKLESLIVPKKPMIFKILVPKLKFILNKEKWMGHLRRAMQMVSKDDYEIIRASLESV